MKTVYVDFEDSKYNYTTSVNPNSTLENLKQYFVGTSFDLGVFPTENLQKCIRIDVVHTDKPIYVDREYTIEGRTDFWKYVVRTPDGIARGFNGNKNNTELYLDSYEFADRICQAKIKVQRANKDWLSLGIKKVKSIFRLKF